MQRCAASCRRGRATRASVGIVADALRKSEAPTLPTTAAVSAAVHPAPFLPAQSKVSPLHPPTTHVLSLALSAAPTQTTTDPTTSNPQPKTPARPHQPTKGSTHLVAEPTLTNKDVNKRGTFSKREADT